MVKKNEDMLSVIELRPNRVGTPRPYVRGTRMRVQDIVVLHQRFGWSAEQIALEQDSLSLAQVHAALAYYFDNRETLQHMIREDETLADQMAARAFPPIRQERENGSSHDSVSS